MQLSRIAEIEYRYVRIEFIETLAGGQYIGTMEGTIRGDRLSGSLYLVNVPPKRADDVNLPDASGMIETLAGARIHTRWRGIARVRESDRARIFTTSATFETAAPEYRWLNASFCVLEGVLDTTTQSARCTLYECVNDQR